jgi:integrase
MARQPKLRKKNGYWMTKAGGTETYFGKVGNILYVDARRLFLDHLKAAAERKQQRRAAITAEVLCDLHLDWLQKNRSADLYKQRRYLLSKWCDFEIGQGRDRQAVGDTAAVQVLADHLVAWKQHLYERKLGDATVQHGLAAVKSCWYWGARHGHLPTDHKPFQTVEKIKLPARAVREEDLLEPEERDLLFQSADTDLGKVRDEQSGKYRRRQLHEYRSGGQNPYAGFSEMLRCYYHTGARTSELADAVVKDVQLRTKKLVLKKHKRTRTMKVAETRVIALNDEAFAILKRHCLGKAPDDHVFTQNNGSPWNKDALDARFRKVRELAGVRARITIYDFRHLWISEALMAGVDVFTVAKMAGTSVQMIEKTYGHLRATHLEEAQRSLDRSRQEAGYLADPGRNHQGSTLAEGATATAGSKRWAGRVSAASC